MHHVPYGLNIIDDNNLKQIEILEARCRKMQYDNITQGQETCDEVMQYIIDVTGGVFDYDSRIFGSDWSLVENPYIGYLTTMDQVNTLYEQLHVADSPKVPIWESGSASVAAGYQSENLIDFSSYYNYLLNESYPFIVMAGEFDSRDGAYSQSLWMK